jgi:hypothetical protein
MELEIHDLDFSFFHPLDHHIWQRAYCASFYGGARTHLSYWWDFQGRHKVRRVWRCGLLRRHNPGEWFRREPGGQMKSAGFVCRDCSIRLEGP